MIRAESLVAERYSLVHPLTIIDELATLFSLPVRIEHDANPADIADAAL